MKCRDELIAVNKGIRFFLLKKETLAFSIN